MRAGRGVRAASRHFSLRGAVRRTVRIETRLTIACGGIVALTSLAAIGDALSAVLVESHALVLMVLTPRAPFLAAAAVTTPIGVFLPLATVRLCVADPLHFRVGQALGPVALDSMGRSRLTRRLTRRLGGRSSVPWLVAVAVSPTGTMMLVAGAVGLPVRSVAAADVAGTLVRVLVLWAAGMALPDLVGVIGVSAPHLVAPICAVLGLGAILQTRRALRRTTRQPGSFQSRRVFD